MNVQSILTLKGTDVKTISSDTTIADAARMLSKEGIGAAVVCEPGATIEGILSERDLVRVVGEHGAESLGWPVSRVMTTTVVTCHPEDRIVGVMSQMTEKRIRHIPVVVDGQMTGVISIGDVVKARMDEIERDATAMQDYITGMTP